MNGPSARELDQAQLPGLGDVNRSGIGEGSMR